MNLFLN